MGCHASECARPPSVAPVCGVAWACMQAAALPRGSMERLLLVAAFAVSAFQSVGNLKCTLPCMGETYEARKHSCSPALVPNMQHVQHKAHVLLLRVSIKLGT